MPHGMVPGHRKAEQLEGPGDRRCDHPAVNPRRSVRIQHSAWRWAIPSGRVANTPAAGGCPLPGPHRPAPAVTRQPKTTAPGAAGQYDMRMMLGERAVRVLGSPADHDATAMAVRTLWIEQAGAVGLVPFSRGAILRTVPSAVRLPDA